MSQRGLPCLAVINILPIAQVLGALSAAQACAKGNCGPSDRVFLQLGGKWSRDGYGFEFTWRLEVLVIIESNVAGERCDEHECVVYMPRY